MKNLKLMSRAVGEQKEKRAVKCRCLDIEEIMK